MSIDLTELKDWRFRIDFEDIAWATFDREDEAMNTLGRRSTEELAAIVSATEEGAKNGSIRGLVIQSAKPTSFIAGADIREFDNLTTESEVEDAVNATVGIFDRIEAMSVPVVAAIHGYCLGGGLELALACHWRVADRQEGTRLGLPEVKLGIFPGLNGTARSIRLAGATPAMRLMLTGRMLRPQAARAMGLVNELVDSQDSLRWIARRAVLRKRKAKGAGAFKKLLNLGMARGVLANQMQKQVAKRARKDHYPAPYALIDLYEKYGGSYERMKAAETSAFVPLMLSDQSKNLRRVFRLSEMLKGQAPKNGFAPMRVHVVGAGTMGGDIAAWCVICGMQVSLQDQSVEQIQKALDRAKSLFKKRLRKRVAVDAAMARLIQDFEGRHIPRADVVIEAIIENLDAKQTLFRELEGKLKPGALLATNTSSLRIEDISGALSDPGRLIGLHFFNPVAQLPLVEVIQGEASRDEELHKGASFVTTIRKFPLIVKSCPGFLVNRVLAPYMYAAIERFESGAEREEIDDAAKAFGMPMGPLELADQVGLDVCKHVSEVLGKDVPPESKLAQLVTEGKLGKKSGEDFYLWEHGKPRKEPKEYEDEHLAELGRELIEPMLEESARCLEEGVVPTSDLVDAGVIFGTGFAPFRGGPLHYRASQGASA